MSTRAAEVDSPFHAGERAVQARLGVSEIEDWARQAIRPFLPDQHRAFYTALPFLVLAARDGEGRPWASLLAGDDGFVQSPHDHRLSIAAAPGAGDALDGALRPGTDVGLLGIDLATRRRNRVNGRLRDAAPLTLELAVAQAFGNCPQYIRERRWSRVADEPVGPALRDDRLSPAQIDWIRGADTFFIASGHRGEGDHAGFGMDASHRGGEAGFVAVESARRLVFPDYAGNNHFNTIGNLMLDPRAGLLFVDFATGGLLQLTGRATIDWDSPALAAHPGARRLVVFEIEAVIERQAAVPLRWSGTADTVRSLRLIDKVRESEAVTSFVFEARDGAALTPFAAGQHLPIVLDIPGVSVPVRRTYSLSGDPGAPIYRISVKRERLGIASRFLHDHLETGAIIDAGRPAGDFVLPPLPGPLVPGPLALISAGVGITPMVAMLHAALADGGDRPILFLHGARDGDNEPLLDEVRALAASDPRVRIHIAHSRPRPADRRARRFDSEGRIDGALVAALTGDAKADYMLCGPSGFMAALRADLRRRGVPAERLRTESFGPAG